MRQESEGAEIRLVQGPSRKGAGWTMAVQRKGLEKRVSGDRRQDLGTGSRGEGIVQI